MQGVYLEDPQEAVSRLTSCSPGLCAQVERLDDSAAAEGGGAARGAALWGAWAWTHRSRVTCSTAWRSTAASMWAAWAPRARRRTSARPSTRRVRPVLHITSGRRGHAARPVLYIVSGKKGARSCADIAGEWQQVCQVDAGRPASLHVLACTWCGTQRAACKLLR